MRWGALAVAVALSVALGLGRAAVPSAIGMAVIAFVRTVAPARLRRGHDLDVLLIALEVAAALLGVTVSRGWGSPFLFSLAATGLVVGYGFGLIRAGLAAIVVGLTVTLAAAATSNQVNAETTTIGWSQVVLVYLVAGYFRRIFIQEAQRASIAMNRVNRLTETNQLLFELHRVTQSLPVSLDLGDTVSVVVGRVRELLQPDVIVILLPDDGTATWSAVVAEGARFPGLAALDDLPPLFGRAANQIAAHLVPELKMGTGLSQSSRSGLYASLRARGQLVGLVGIERREAFSFTGRDTQLLEGVGEQAALAIDNARLFRRLRRVGADEERGRIARDLHDRVGQSLAYLGFELERLVAKTDASTIKPELESLRNDVRQAVSEIRETLYDLRTEVTEQIGLPEVLDDFVQRVKTRSGLAIELHIEVKRRLPLTHERELLRITQEAVTNIERHAHARTIKVSLQIGRDEAILDVTDDGDGFVATTAGRPDSYGLIGMRERADAIGAALEIATAPGRGTNIRCRLGSLEERGTSR